MIYASVVAALLICVAIFTAFTACRADLEGLNINQAATLDASKGRVQNHSHYRDGIDLSEDDRYGFLRVWYSVLEQSERDPQAAVRYADFLMSDLMDECGSAECNGVKRSWNDPIGEIRDSDIQEEIQTAHEIAVHSKQGRVNAIDARRAMRLYAELFDKLVG